MSAMQFTVQLHGPFLLGTGLSGDGLDDQADHQSPLPGSALKGLMRASARRHLGLPKTLVDEVFGKPGRESAWAWSEAGEPAMFAYLRRSRNRVDPATGVAAEEALAAVEEVWLRPGCAPSFQITPLIANPPEDHGQLLLAASFGVTAVGKWRNRGMGTASFRPDPMLSPEAAKSLAHWVLRQRAVGPA
ncbi:MAG: RAMP superfamily CRISPR-associated protein [Candidatus Nanopelagicales bacterium]